MSSNPLSMLVPEIDLNYILINKIAVLAIALLFFLVVYFLNTFLKKGLSFSKVTATIKIAVMGFLLLLLETRLQAVPHYGKSIGIVQSLIVMLCLANLVAYLVVDLYLYYRRKKQVPSFLRDLWTLLVYVVAAMMSLRIIFHIDVASILTTTTILTAAIAFAMQTTLANIISGFNIQNDRNMRTGTWISIKEKDLVGKIVNVGFRYTMLKTVDNHMVMVPNHFFMQNVVASLGNAEDREKTAVNVKVGLGYDLPPEKAKEILLPVLREQKGISKHPPPSVVITDFRESAVEYNLKFYLEDYSTRLVTTGSVLNQVWYALMREGHSFPYPHREIIEKTPKIPFAMDRAIILESLRKAAVLGALGEEELRQLADRGRIRVYGNGEVVVRQGDPGHSLFIVKRGSLSVFVDDSLVGRLDGGDVFGEMSLLTGEKRKATVVAENEARVIEISKEDIGSLIRGNTALLDRLSTILDKRAETNKEYLSALELARPAASRKEAFALKLKAFFGL